MHFTPRRAHRCGVNTEEWHGLFPLTPRSDYLRKVCVKSTYINSAAAHQSGERGHAPLSHSIIRFVLVSDRIRATLWTKLECSSAYPHALDSNQVLPRSQHSLHLVTEIPRQCLTPLPVFSGASLAQAPHSSRTITRTTIFHSCSLLWGQSFP